MIEKQSSGGIVLNGDKVLTLFVPDHNEIIFPKGTIEEGESPEETAVREVLEETGYKVEIVSKVDDTTYEFGEDGQHFRKTVSFFLMRLIDDENLAPNFQEGEEFENLWLTTKEAKVKLTHDQNKKLLEKAVAASLHSS